jgi:hypothetical protein
MFAIVAKPVILCSATSKASKPAVKKQKAV